MSITFELQATLSCGWTYDMHTDFELTQAVLDAVINVSGVSQTCRLDQNRLTLFIGRQFDPQVVLDGVEEIFLNKEALFDLAQEEDQ